MNKHAVLIIESNDWDREQIRTYVKKLSIPVRILNARHLANSKTRVDVIILGVSDAISLETARTQLNKVRSSNPMAQLILCAPRETKDLDAKILELNARAFVLKPIDQETFATLLEETLSQIQLRKQREAYARGRKRPSDMAEIIGSSEAIQPVLQLLEKVTKSSNTSVLLLGESGVGKSLFAKTIHDRCAQAHGPFIEINCTTLPTQLLESELFGYEPGAFTDARSQKIGLIELADGGTLFLDEITEVDLQTQAKLLKFLDSKRFRRLGGDFEITVDVRVVAASNLDVKTEVRSGNFREDLYYRLNVVEIVIPPLRERRSDIDVLTAYYFDFYKKKFNKSQLELSVEAMEVIREYRWPGNVRELINVLERAVLLSPEGVIEAGDLPIQKKPGPKTLGITKDGEELVVTLPDDGVSLDLLEQSVIESTLVRTRGNVSQAANMLHISRGALRNKLARYGIDPHAYHGRALATKL
jgi:two-component system response regulator AtoC